MSQCTTGAQKCSSFAGAESVSTSGKSDRGVKGSSCVSVITLCASALIASCMIIAGLLVSFGIGVYFYMATCVFSRGDRRGTAFGVGMAMRMGFTFMKRGSTFCGRLMGGTAPGVLFFVTLLWLRFFRRKILFFVGLVDVVTWGVSSTPGRVLSLPSGCVFPTLACGACEGAFPIL